MAAKNLGIDEHRYRSVRFYRTETGAWARYEPWMSTIVDVTPHDLERAHGMARMTHLDTARSLTGRDR